MRAGTLAAIFFFVVVVSGSQWPGHFDFSSKTKVSTATPLLNAIPTWSMKITEVNNDVFITSPESSWFSNARWPTTFVQDNKFYFLVNGHSTSSQNWKKYLGKWDPLSPTAGWIDPTPADSPATPFAWPKTEPISPGGLLAGNQDVMSLVIGHLGKPTGVACVTANGASSTGYLPWGCYGYATENIERMAATDFFLPEIWQPPRVLSTFHQSQTYSPIRPQVYYWDGVYYLYVPTKGPNSTNYISLVTSPNMVNFTVVNYPVLTGYVLNYVAKHASSSTYYTLALHAATAKWHILRGSSPALFDTANPVSTNLEVQATPDAWDYTFRTFAAGTEGRIFSMQILNDKMYIFYLAGNTATMGTSINRGIGVYTVPYVPTPVLDTGCDLTDFKGSSLPGYTVRVFVDNQLVKNTTATEDGRFFYEISSQFVGDAHTIQFQAVSLEGAVSELTDPVNFVVSVSYSVVEH